MKNLAGKVSHLLIAGMLVISGCGGKGDPGAAGSSGEKGADGTQGTPGAPGAPGANGDAGLPGKPGTSGTNGANGDAGLSTAPLSLTITNSITNAAVSSASVTLAPTGTIAIDATTGKGSATLAIGDYTLTIKATGYTTGTQDVEVVAGFAQALTIKLVPTANVVANAGADITGKALGATVTLTAPTVSVLDGSTGTTYSWKQVSGPTATLTGATTATPSVTLPDAAGAQKALIDALTSATDVTSASNGDPIRRLDVVGINPFSIEEATTVGLQVTVTTSSGSYTDTVNVAATSPFEVTSGLRNVPIGIPQLLQAGPLPTGTTTWAWTLTTVPAGSAATLTGTASQFPTFKPDIAGTYVISETSTGGKLTMYAGTWAGAIGGIDATDGLPIKPADTCGQCHEDSTAPDKWKEWRKTGHAVIVPENVDVPGGHWAFTSCGSCHSVGYNLTATNGGADDDYAKIRLANTSYQFPSGAPLAYENMFKDTSAQSADVIKLATKMNVQCENCHGPNTSNGHKTSDDTKATFDGTARVSLKAEVCGSCHGEPVRHGRYQQWQDSKHANTSLAMQRAAADATTALPAHPASDTANCDATCQATWASTSNNGNHCARCHSGEGYVIWQDQAATAATPAGLDFSKKIQGAAGDATLTEVVADGLVKANVHSQTCATCHDPHDVGKTAQEQSFIDPVTGKLSDLTKNNTTNVRVMDDIAMLPAGFAAPGLGKGSICATCHNGRNGAHNDTVDPTTYAKTNGVPAISTPHDSTAAEVVLGQNVYFVTNGQRGGHSFISNVCVNCHMELTPQPANFSFPGTGTNHTFAADNGICNNCHGAFDGGSIQTATKSSLTNLTQFIGSGAAKALNGKVVWARAQRIPASATDTTTVFSHAAAATASDLTAYNVLVDLTTNSIASAVLLEDSSNIQITLTTAIPITWTDNTSGTPAQVKTFIISMSNIRNDDGTGTTPMATLPISLTGNLAKAIWNYITLYREGSFGIHNPGFTNSVIGATMAQDLTK